MSLRDALLKINHSNNNMKMMPHSMYKNTAEYFREKIGDRLPDHQYELMEIQSYPQYFKDNNYIDTLKQNIIEHYNQLMDEFKEKEEEGKNDLSLEDLNINKENFFIAK